MKSMFQAKGFRFAISSVAALALGGLLMSAPATDASGQILERGAQGAVGGAIIGGILGGGKGAARGAAIGAAAGAVVGAAEKDARAAPPPPGHGPVPPGYGPNLVCDIQTSLTKLGYDPGPIDCQYGNRTADAIRAYEFDNRLPQTGVPSEELYGHMIRNGG